MPGMHELSRTQARRIAVQAQRLDAARPDDLIEVVRWLTALQADSTKAVAPSADVVAWSRLGPAYQTADLAEALRDGSLVELRSMIRPGEDIALFRAEMAAWPGPDEPRTWRHSQSDWVDINDGFRTDILDRLERDGPLIAREIDDTSQVSWKSSGWNNNRNINMMLEFLELRGEVAVAGHRGRDREWDLAWRVYPDNEVVPLDEAFRIRRERRLQSLGIARVQGPESPIESTDLTDIGEPATVEGLRGQWRLDPRYLDQPFHGRCAILSPLDRLVYDRKRMEELFEFDYQLEMYKPAAKRRWGYWAMPILSGDRLVGKVDATSHRDAGVLQVDAIHEDEPFSKALAAAVRRELTDLARCLQLDLALPS